MKIAKLLVLGGTLFAAHLVFAQSEDAEFKKAKACDLAIAQSIDPNRALYEVLNEQPRRESAKAKFLYVRSNRKATSSDATSRVRFGFLTKDGSFSFEDDVQNLYHVNQKYRVSFEGLDGKQKTYCFEHDSNLLFADENQRFEESPPATCSIQQEYKAVQAKLDLPEARKATLKELYEKMSSSISNRVTSVVNGSKREEVTEDHRRSFEGLQHFAVKSCLDIENPKMKEALAKVTDFRLRFPGRGPISPSPVELKPAER